MKLLKVIPQGYTILGKLNLRLVLIDRRWVLYDGEERLGNFDTAMAANRYVLDNWAFALPIDTKELRAHMRYLGRERPGYALRYFKDAPPSLLHAYWTGTGQVRTPLVYHAGNYLTLKSWNELPKKHRLTMPKNEDPDINHYMVYAGKVYNLCDALRIGPDALKDPLGDYDEWDAFVFPNLFITYHPDDAGRVRVGRLVP